MLIHYSKFLTLVFITMLVSCSVGPEYKRSKLHRETLNGKKIWSQAPSSENIIRQNKKKLNYDWWRGFKDEYLNRLIREAVSGSLDIEIRLKRAKEAELSMQRSKARFLPSANISGNSSYFLQRVERIDVSEPILDEDDLKERIEESVSTTEDSQYYNLGLNVNWEFDLWGKKKKNYLSMKASYDESRAMFRAEYLRIISDVAKTYFDIRKKDKELIFNTKLMDISREKLSIYENQFAEGLIKKWRIIRHKQEINSLNKELLEITRSRKRLENKMALLLGKHPGEFKVPDTGLKGSLETIEVPPGLPSELLLARPDVIAAEYRVKKAYYKIGESIAARLPSISLTGQAGLASTALSTLLSQWTFGITPVFSLPVFDGGAKKKQVEISRLQADIAEKEYKNTVLRAFEEVENTLSDVKNRKKQKQILENKIQAIKKIKNQTFAKFDMGLISRLKTLEIERELLNGSRPVLEIERMLVDDSITLCKALGGGW